MEDAARVLCHVLANGCNMFGIHNSGVMRMDAAAKEVRHKMEEAAKAIGLLPKGPGAIIPRIMPKAWSSMVAGIRCEVGHPLLLLDTMKCQLLKLHPCNRY